MKRHVQSLAALDQISRIVRSLRIHSLPNYSFLSINDQRNVELIVLPWRGEKKEKKEKYFSKNRPFLSDGISIDRRYYDEEFSV